MKISTLLIAIPLVAAAGVIAVANREVVTFRLDPFSADAPSVSVSLPLYMLVFLSFFAGVLLGGLTVLWRRARAARNAQARAMAVRE